MEKTELGDINDLTSVVYGLRMLMFLEDEPQSNKYRQIILTPKEYQAVQFAYGTHEKNEDGTFTLNHRMGDKVYVLPDLIEIYEKQESNNDEEGIYEGA